MIPVINRIPVPPEQKWDHILSAQAQPFRCAPCFDCAVTKGMYRPISEELAIESPEVRQAVSERWHCHNSPNRACRGNAELVKVV